ncbi:MAG: OmpA family protein [Deltaproteobacteria bacterium]|nr:OmpA family protein [Deltaproteobacteria bacterium]
MKRYPRRPPSEQSEFLWLVSLSDLMILLFVLFVMLFALTYKKLKQTDFQKIVSALRNEAPPPTPMEKVTKQLSAWVKERNLEDKIAIQQTDDAVLVQIKDKVFFESGRFELHKEGVTALQSLTSTLETIPPPHQLGIEGHTDDIPIHSKEIQDNWDLSSRRANSVLRALAFSPDMLKRTVVMGYGETRPIVPNRDTEGTPLPDNQSKNRRVTLRIY